MKRVLAEVRNFEVIAQEIITVEFYKGVEIEQCFDAKGGGDNQGEVIGERGGISKTPEECGERPAKDLKPGARERDQEALASFGKEPGIAHIAVHGRLEIDQKKSDFVHLAAETFAGQPVRQLVANNNSEQSYPGEQDGLGPVKACDTAMNFLPTGEHHAGGEQDDGD